MIIAWYLRSGNKMDSLENQRAYLKQYLSRKTDLLKKQEGGILEYIDSAGALSDTCSDTGENSFWFHAAEKNAGFDTMLEDAKKGRFQVLVIKNLSSFGMDEERISSYVQEIFLCCMFVCSWQKPAWTVRL